MCYCYYYYVPSLRCHTGHKVDYYSYARADRLSIFTIVLARSNKYIQSKYIQMLF
jgi:hypothetical protein